MRILVVGAGATGGYFGGRLAEAGRDVTFLVRPRRAAQLRSSGIVIHSPHGDVRLAPRLTTAAELATASQSAGAYDLVLLTVKAYALDRAVEDMAPGVGPETVILPVLNGMRHLQVVGQRFGGRTVLGGVCQVTTTLEPDGAIRQLNEVHQLAYGVSHPPGPAPSADLDVALGGAGFTARRSDEILREMWEKWVYVATVGAVTCLMRGTVGEIVAAPGGRDFAVRVLAECAAVAAAAGYPVRAPVLAKARATVTAPGSSTASSLYRDLLGGGPVEADHIVGDLVDRAADLGVDVPLLRLAGTHLRVYEHTRN